MPAKDEIDTVSYVNTLLHTFSPTLYGEFTVGVNWAHQFTSPFDAAAFARMKKGVMVINTSRGALIDTKAAIAALKSGIIGHLGLDVYEEEGELFFEDHSRHVIQDDVFARLLTFPNVLITGHQGFFTREALAGIAETTLRNLTAFERGEGELHRVAARA